MFSDLQSKWYTSVLLVMKKPPTLLVSTQDNWSILIILCQVRGLFLVTLLLRELNFQVINILFLSLIMQENYLAKATGIYH